MNEPVRPIVSRYASLPLLSLLLRLCGYTAFLFGIGQAALVLWQSDWTGRWSTPISSALQSVFWGFVRALELIIIAEGIHVLLDIEQNTRRTADAVEGTVTRSTPRNS